MRTGQHVVAREAAEQHLVERAQPDLRRVGDPPPAGRLEAVPDAERDDREQHEPDVGVRRARARTASRSASRIASQRKIGR